MDCSPPDPLSMGFPRQEYWRGLPFPPPKDLANPVLDLNNSGGRNPNTPTVGLWRLLWVTAEVTGDVRARPQVGFSGLVKGNDTVPGKNLSGYTKRRLASVDRSGPRRTTKTSLAQGNVLKVGSS